MRNYEICQRNDWKAGTRLVGDEGYGPTVIEIVFISQQTLIAKAISHNGEAESHPMERTWTLACRDWAEVP